ncbi:uncharacterized protein LOC117482559 isoform X2 [Trematomus bernacchii]|uniref:uncharacterized protein LOC117482559 isoform X2 n=1 Tax=Trematomus bernacchii TaxID=40690 RepID=UPI00146A52B0|nr:uncharacterized protein LOC117482559 isoform X2 [Trematomus bernacchii]
MSQNYPYRPPPADSNLRPVPGPYGSSDRRYASSSTTLSSSDFYRPPPESILPPPSSSRGSSWSQDGALSILNSFGLEPAELALLAELPEDILTVESLPQVLKQIKGKRGTVRPLNTPSSSSSSSYPPRSSTTSNWDPPRNQYPQSHLTPGNLLPELDSWGHPITFNSPSSSSSSSYQVDFKPGASGKTGRNMSPFPPKDYNHGHSEFGKKADGPVVSQDYNYRPGPSDFGKMGKDAGPVSSLDYDSRPSDFGKTGRNASPFSPKDYNHGPSEFGKKVAGPSVSQDYNYRPGPSDFGKMGRDAGPVSSVDYDSRPSDFGMIVAGPVVSQDYNYDSRPSDFGNTGRDASLFPPKDYNYRTSDYVQSSRDAAPLSSLDYKHESGPSDYGKTGRYASPVSSLDYNHGSAPADFGKKGSVAGPVSPKDYNHGPSEFGKKAGGPLVSQDYIYIPGPSDFGKKGSVSGPVSSQVRPSFGSAGRDKKPRPSCFSQPVQHYGSVPPPPPEEPLLKPGSGRDGGSEVSSRMPSKEKALDFHGKSPPSFPYSSSLCDITVMSEKVWIKHINGPHHADGQLSLLQHADSQSEKKNDEAKPARQQAANQKSSNSQPKNALQKKVSEKCKVVCVKFPAQSVDEAYLKKLTEPFGKIVMFPSLAFVELGSADQARDLVKYHENFPLTVNGAAIEFKLSNTFSFLQSSRVVSFCPAPSGDDSQSDLLTIVKRFGEPILTLFLPSKAYVEMKDTPEAQKLVDFYSSRALKINNNSITVSFSGEFKTLSGVAAAKSYEETISTKRTRSTSREEEGKRKRRSSKERSRSTDKNTKEDRTKSRSREKSKDKDKKKFRSREKSSMSKSTRTRSRSRERSIKEENTRSRSRSRDKTTRTRSRSRERAIKEENTRSRSREESTRERRSGSKSRSKHTSSRDKTTRTRSRSRERAIKEENTRSRSRERSIKEENTRSRSRSRDKTTRTRSRSREKSTKDENTRSKSRSKSRSRDKTTRTRSRSRERAIKEENTRSRSREESTRERRSGSKSSPREKSSSGSSEKNQTETKSEEPEEPEKTEKTEKTEKLEKTETTDSDPVTDMKPAAEEEEEEEEEESSAEESDLEGMEMIGEDGESLEEDEEEEEEEEHRPAERTDSPGEGQKEEVKDGEEVPIKEEEEVPIRQQEEEVNMVTSITKWITEVGHRDGGTEHRIGPDTMEPAKEGIPMRVQPPQPRGNRKKRRELLQLRYTKHDRSDHGANIVLSPRNGSPPLLSQVITLAQSPSQRPTDERKKGRGAKIFLYPQKETRKHQGRIKSPRQGEPPSKRIQVKLEHTVPQRRGDPGTKALLPETIQEAAAQQLEHVEQPPHEDEEKVKKPLTFKITDKTKNKCDPADARRCASWAGEYVAGEPVGISHNVPPGWVIATWGGDYFICPKERCPSYGKWLDNEEPPVHIQDALKPLMTIVSEENDFQSQHNLFVLPENEDCDDWHPIVDDQTKGRAVLYTHSPIGGYRKCCIRYFSNPNNWDTLAGFRYGERGFHHLTYIWKYDENWHRALLDRSAMVWQNKGDKEFNTKGGIKSLQVTCFKTNSNSSYFAITDDGCGNMYMLTDTGRNGCYGEV